MQTRIVRGRALRWFNSRKPDKEINNKDRWWMCGPCSHCQYCHSYWMHIVAYQTSITAYYYFIMSNCVVWKPHTTSERYSFGLMLVHIRCGRLLWMLNGEWSPRFSGTACLAAACLLMCAVPVVNANLLVKMNAVCLSLGSIGETIFISTAK